MGRRIAIASSGLGHVRRGIETWADDLAAALQRAGEQATLFQGAPGGSESWRRTLACCRRFGPRSAQVLSVTGKLGGWRYGFGSEYEIEQSTFAFSLWRAIRKDFDILHVQDPWLARVLDVLNRKGWSKPRVILGHGTEEPESELYKYSYLQHLAPWYRDRYADAKPAGQHSFAVPNFVDMQRFTPGNRAEARSQWGFPQDAFIVFSAAALKKHHKRGDYLIREFEAFRRSAPGRSLLIMAGAREHETAELMQLGKSVLGDSLVMMESLDRSKLPSLYRAADVFAIASLHEMMPIVTLEALASGLPISCNATPILTWITGPAGYPEDISQPGGLVRQWERLTDCRLRAELAERARLHAENTFAEPVVLRQMVEMYDAVLSS
jgi:1,2-diacylglycerol 3-alpha-glucosyltransferase